jgi:hypothetical protein
MRGKDFDHVPTKAKCLKDFSRSERAGQHGDLRPTRRIDHLRDETRGDDELCTGVHCAPGCVGVRHSARANQHFVAEVFRDGRDGPYGARDSHRDLGDDESRFHQSLDYGLRGVSAVGSDYGNDSDLAKGG